MSLKRITTPQGDVYFIDSVSGQRVKTNMDVIKSKTDVNNIPTVEEKILSPEEEQIENLKKTKKWHKITAEKKLFTTRKRSLMKWKRI